jgi:hypothetical protein
VNNDRSVNALAETTVGLVKNELTRRQGPWRDVDQVELGTAQRIAWFNTDAPTNTFPTSHPRPLKTFTTLANMPYRRHGEPTTAVSGHSGAGHTE